MIDFISKKHYRIKEKLSHQLHRLINRPNWRTIFAAKCWKKWRSELIKNIIFHLIWFNQIEVYLKNCDMKSQTLISYHTEKKTHFKLRINFMSSIWSFMIIDRVQIDQKRKKKNANDDAEERKMVTIFVAKITKTRFPLSND